MINWEQELNQIAQVSNERSAYKNLLIKILLGLNKLPRTTEGDVSTYSLAANIEKTMKSFGVDPYKGV